MVSMVLSSVFTYLQFSLVLSISVPLPLHLSPNEPKSRVTAVIIVAQTKQPPTLVLCRPQGLLAFLISAHTRFSMIKDRPGKAKPKKGSEGGDSESASSKLASWIVRALCIWEKRKKRKRKKGRKEQRSFLISFFSLEEKSKTSCYLLN